MMITTTGSLEGHKILEYKGLVFGEMISGVNMFRDMGASLRNVFGGRSQGYEQSLCETRSGALDEMQQRAAAMGANAVIGVKVDYEMLGANNGMMMVSCTGTAVVVE